MLQSGFHGWQHRRVQHSGDQEPAHARMSKDSSSSSSSNRAGVAGVGGVSGWMGRTYVRVLGISFCLRHAGDPTQRASGKSEPVGTAWLHQVWWTGEGWIWWL